MKTAAITLVVAAIFFLPLSCDAEQRSFAERLVAEYYSQFQKPGFLVDQLMEFYGDGVLFIDPTFEIVAEGKSEVRKLYAQLGTEGTAYRNIVWTISDIISQGETIVIRGKWSGRFHECDFDVDFMTLWKLADDKIVEQHDFFAAGTFDRQVGWNGTAATCESG
jgi:ketosteroid isomerase-like protein